MDPRHALARAVGVLDRAASGAPMTLLIDSHVNLHHQSVRRRSRSSHRARPRRRRRPHDHDLRQDRKLRPSHRHRRSARRHLRQRRRASALREGSSRSHRRATDRTRRHERVVGVGETGLDQHYKFSPFEDQVARVSRPRRGRARAGQNADHPHARSRCRDGGVVGGRGGEGPSSHSHALLHERRGTGASRARNRRVLFVLRHHDVQERQRRARDRAAKCPWTASSSRPIAHIWPLSRIAANAASRCMSATCRARFAALRGLGEAEAAPCSPITSSASSQPSRGRHERHAARHHAWLRLFRRRAARHWRLGRLRSERSRRTGARAAGCCCRSGAGRRARPEQATTVLIDTPPELRLQLAAAGPSHLDAVLISHDHADQTNGFDDIRAFFIKQRTPDPGMARRPARGETFMRRFGYAFVSEGGYPAIARDAGHMAPLMPVTIDGPGGALEVLPLEQDHGFSRSLGFRAGPARLFERSGRHAGSDVRGARRAGSSGSSMRCATRRIRRTPTSQRSLAWIERLKPELTRADQHAHRSGLRGAEGEAAGRRRTRLRWLGARSIRSESLLSCFP